MYNIHNTLGLLKIKNCCSSKTLLRKYKASYRLKDKICKSYIPEITDT